MTTRQAICQEGQQQCLLGDGVTTFVMEPARCISAVCVQISFNLPFLLHLDSVHHFVPPTPYLDIACCPSWALLIVFVRHMFIFFSPGLTIGGVWGLREGARRPLAVPNTRLRINSVLNSVTRRGTFIGNSAGVLGQPSSLPKLKQLL
jgi:hypothetical protein